MNTVMNMRFPQNVENFLTVEDKVLKQDLSTQLVVCLFVSNTVKWDRLPNIGAGAARGVECCAPVTISEITPRSFGILPTVTGTDPIC